VADQAVRFISTGGNDGKDQQEASLERVAGGGKEEDRPRRILIVFDTTRSDAISLSGSERRCWKAGFGLSLCPY
jgi:hypothetical protein